MPKPSTLAIAPLPASDENPGQGLARIRRERSFTQVELAERTGFIQTLVSDYERGNLRFNADMIFRFASALDVSTDDLLRPASEPEPARKPSRRVLQRIERIEALPAHVQTTVLKSLDLMLKSVAPTKSGQGATRPSNESGTPAAASVAREFHKSAKEPASRFTNSPETLDAGSVLRVFLRRQEVSR